jgi:hypothetical protein
MLYIVFPVRLDFDYVIAPIVNWCLVGVAALLFLSGLLIPSFGRDTAAFSLNGGDLLPWGLALFVNTHPVSFLVCLLILWVFGGAVNSSVGNALYAALVLLASLFGSLLHLLGGHHSSPGLEPAVALVMGMSLIAFPLSEVRCFYAGIGFFGSPRMGTWQFRSYWLVSGWIGIAGLLGASGFAAASLGSQLLLFVAGGIAALLLVYAGRVRNFCPTIVDVARGHADDEFRRDNRLRDRLEMVMDPGAPSSEEVFAIGEKLRAEGKETHQAWIGADGSPDGAPEPSLTPAAGGVPPGLTLPEPRITVLRTVRQGGLLTCYFVNEGDEVRNIEILSVSGQATSFHPRARLARRESGWFSVQRMPAGPVGGFEFVITFDGAEGFRGERTFRIPPRLQ